MRSLFQFGKTEAAPIVEPVPTVFPEVSGAQIAAVFAGKRMAGDFYDSIRVSPERVLFGMLDVAGRRADNRPILTAAQKIFRNFGTELFSKPDINESEAMTELSIRLNREIIESCDGVCSCPSFIGCYHEQFGTLCYTNAGHTPGLLRDHSGVSELASTGLPLGLFSHATLDAPTVGVEDGGAILLVSRGVLECEGRKSSGEYGLDRVKPLLQSSLTTKPQELCVSVLDAAHEFSGRAPLCDDRTALALIREA
jgi:phosphoserine phosphatase RsbU/P